LANLKSDKEVTMKSAVEDKISEVKLAETEVTLTEDMEDDVRPTEATAADLSR